MACADSPRLLPEIVNLVIDESRHDVKALAQLGLVSHSTYWRTREHLFVFVELRGSARTERLLELLQKKVELGRCVRDLSLIDKPDWNGAADLEPRNDRQILDQWLRSSADHLVPLLSLLPSLSGFGLAGGFCSPLRWHSLPVALQIAIFDLIAMPQIDHVNFTCIIGLPVSPFAQFHHINRLVFRLILRAGGSDSLGHLPLNAAAKLPTQPRKAGGLRELSIGTCGSFLTSLFACLEDSEATLNIRGLEYLRLDFAMFNSSMEPALNAILSHSAQNIKSLDVFSAGPEIIPPQSFALYLFPSLQHFSLKVGHFPGGNDQRPLFLASLRTLAQVRPRNRLTSLEFSLHFGLFASAANIYEDLSRASFWPDLDGVLSSSEFSSLKLVTIILGTDPRATAPGHGWWTGQATNALQRSFSKLSTSKSCNLQIQVSID